MTKLKAAMAAAAAASLIVTSFAYTTKINAPTAKITYYYCGATTNGTSILPESDVRKSANWTTTLQIGSSGVFLNSITFAQESDNVSNGITDGQYSLQEAIDALWFHYLRFLKYSPPTQKKCITPPESGASAICIE